MRQQNSGTTEILISVNHKDSTFFFVVVVIIKTFLASIPVLNHLETEEKGRISDTNPIFIYNFDIVFVMYILYSFLFLKHV